MATPSTTASNRIETLRRKVFDLFPISMESLGPTRRQLSISARYLDESDARDKICRAIQYGSKFISGGKEGVAHQVDLSTASARKVFRLLKSINELNALVTPSPKSEHSLLVVLSKSKHSLMAMYLALDHLVWAGQTGIYKNERRIQLVSNISLYFFLGGCACNSLAELLRLVWKEKHERDSVVIQGERKEQRIAHLLGFVKSSLDIVVAIGLLQLAPKRVTPRLTGACGTVTSLLGCYELFRETSTKYKTY